MPRCIVLSCTGIDLYKFVNAAPKREVAFIQVITDLLSKLLVVWILKIFEFQQSLPYIGTIAHYLIKQHVLSYLATKIESILSTLFYY